jgi:tetratricopeptide (TPR) repeat protein
MRTARPASAIGVLFLLAGCATPPRAGLDHSEIEKLLEEDEFQSVIELCTKRLEGSPNDFDALEFRVWSLFHTGAEKGVWSEEDRAAVARDCGRMEDLAPDSISPWLLRAFMSEPYREALDVWGEGIRRVEAAGDDATQLRYFRAKCLFRQRRDEEALADCRKALAGLDTKLGRGYTGYAELAQRAELRWWLAASETDPERKRDLERGAESDEALARRRHEKRGYGYSPVRHRPRGPELIEMRIRDEVPAADAGDRF